MSETTLSIILSIASLLGLVGGFLVFIWKGGQWQAQIEQRVTRNLEKITAVESTMEKYGSLQSIPQQIAHMSAQMDKIASNTEELARKTNDLQSISLIKSKLLDLLEAAKEDHEKRLRQLEAASRRSQH